MIQHALRWKDHRPAGRRNRGRALCITGGVACVIAGALFSSGCGGRENAGFVRSVDAWHAQRIARLQAADGWLTLIGLFRLTAGAHTLGTGEDADLRIEAAAAPLIGTFSVKPDGVSFAANEGVAVHAASTPSWPEILATDRGAAPTVLQVGTLSFHIIERGDALLLRVRDSESAVRRGFRGIDRFAVDPSWRVAARIESGDAPTTVSIPDVLGGSEQRPSPGVLVFERDGVTHRLIPIGEPGQPLFIIFNDRTSGVSTYGGGRYLYADAPGPDGIVVLDFNRAYNPPCVFTPYATCPLPPGENHLQIAVTAGEKTWPTEH